MTTLEPKDADSWTSFLDTLRPPPGYDLEAGIGTTYGLSMEVLTAALLGFVNVEGSTPGDLTTTLLALMRVADRLRVFVQRGFDPDVANSVPDVYALLDRIVRDVCLPKTPARRPSFHPKLWAFSFLRRPRPELRHHPERIYRLLCASRNVTKSRCWELGLRLDGTDTDANAKRKEEATASPIGEDAARFLEQLLKGRDEPPHFQALANRLRRAHFKAAGDLRELRLHAGWPGSAPLFDQLPPRGKRAMVVSAFLRPDFLGEIAARFDKLTIVSKQDQLDALERPLDPRVEAATKYVVTTETSSDSEFCLDGLHAKLVICEVAKNDRVTFQGSANATRAGWGRADAKPADKAKQNCEVIVSARPGLSLDAFAEAFVCDAKGVLRPWITEYRQQPVAETDDERARQELRDWLSELAAIDLRQRYDSAAKCLVLSVRTSVPISEPPIPGAVAQVAPMLLQTRHNGFRPYGETAGAGVHYDDVLPASVTDFVILRARAPSISDVVCVVIARCTGLLPEDRDVALNQKLLQNADPRRLLEAILFGAERHAHRGSQRTNSGDDANAGERHGGEWVAGLTLERLLEACVERPSVVEEIESWLSWCPADKVPAAFAALWESFRGAGISSLRGKRDGR